MPSKNTCYLTINKSPDADDGIVGEYRIYHSTVNDAYSASENPPVGTITSNLTGTNNFSYDVSELDGSPHYFFLSAVNKNDSKLENSSQ